MKNIYFFLITLFIFICNNINAQQIFSTSGKVISNGNLNLSYTIGEPLVSKNTNGDIILSNGFQHAIIATITKTKNNLFAANELLVYPNPNSGILNIDNKTNNINLDIYIYDLNGQIVFKNKYEELRQEQINMSNFSNALYILKVEDSSKELFNTYKIQLTK
jgi:hypothetical protein